jgi:hypothetical protein
MKWKWKWKLLQAKKGCLLFAVCALDAAQLQYLELSRRRFGD